MLLVMDQQYDWIGVASTATPRWTWAARTAVVAWALIGRPATSIMQRIMQELQQACGFTGFALMRLPRECSVGCSSVFTPLYRDCHQELQQDLPGVTMTAVQAFITLCSAGAGGGGGGGGH